MRGRVDMPAAPAEWSGGGGAMVWLAPGCSRWIWAMRSTTRSGGSVSPCKRRFGGCQQRAEARGAGAGAGLTEASRPSSRGFCRSRASRMLGSRAETSTEGTGEGQADT